MVGNHNTYITLHQKHKSNWRDFAQIWWHKYRHNNKSIRYFPSVSYYSLIMQHKNILHFAIKHTNYTTYYKLWKAFILSTCLYTAHALYVYTWTSGNMPTIVLSLFWSFGKLEQPGYLNWSLSCYEKANLLHTKNKYCIFPVKRLTMFHDWCQQKWR